MKRKLTVALLLGLVMAFLLASIAQGQEPRPTPTNVPAEEQETAQETRGSIRGAVLLDANVDGDCADDGDGGVADVSVEFTSSDGQTVVSLFTGDDGSYGLVAVGLGTWSVTVEPPGGYSVVGSNPRSVFLSEDARTADNVDFCLTQAATETGTGGTGTGGTGDGGTLLPESGAPQQAAAQATETLLSAIALLGIGLIAIGTLLAFRDYRLGQTRS